MIIEKARDLHTPRNCFETTLNGFGVWIRAGEATWTTSCFCWTGSSSGRRRALRRASLSKSRSIRTSMLTRQATSGTADKRQSSH